MLCVHTIAELRAALADQPRVGLVPTMGNLHPGHLSLLELAQQHSDFSVVSIFVNPLQFGAGEDFANYPRTLDADCAALHKAGCDLVFAPSASELYPAPQTFLIEPPAALANTLCGEFRPGHFAGVATVVAKLFNLVAPQVAAFGKKDFQQLAVIRGLVQQFNLPIDILAGDTLRAADGLALSSRNQYLSDADRPRASQLYAELQGIAQHVARGERDAERLTHNAARHLKMAGWEVDYVAVRNADSLQSRAETGTAWVALAAARLGNIRLIDNLEMPLG